jgi:hypothetical protein
MIPYLGCHVARELLQGFVDSELPMSEQVALEAHLRWCSTCRARVEDMRLIGASLRLGSPAPVTDDDAAEALTVIQSEVLARVRAERDLSWSVRFSLLFEDMRFMWPALGATAALMMCVLAITNVDRATRTIGRNSLADRIQTLANPGSDRNPVHLDAWMLAPGLLTESPVLRAMPDPSADEAMITLAAVVTREGRVANYELLQPGAATAGVLDAVRQARFTPAQTGSGPVAVNVVWVIERTTVKAPRRSQKLEALAPLQPIPDVVVRPISVPPEPALPPARS